MAVVVVEVAGVGKGIVAVIEVVGGEKGTVAVVEGAGEREVTLTMIEVGSGTGGRWRAASLSHETASSIRETASSPHLPN